ncbi:MAG: hypothetical protein R3B99_29435 [Polyangiales bacterium]|nr:hypothetical protein [Myxococcales bacterium]MCB9599017.1 hypothetical protein [Sandaracinus sp.]MCB9623344.1 hypothetical protein [Sandaracinus sp.]
MRRVLPGLALFLLATLVTTQAHATLARAMDLAELVREAEVIALVEVTSQSARRDARQRIVTDVQMDVLEPVKGSPGARFTLVRIGGEIGEVGMTIAGETSFVDGQRYVIFARPSTMGPGFRPVGMSQGVMMVEQDDQGTPQVLPGGGGLSLVDPRTGAHQPPAITGPTRLDVLLDEIRRLAR